MVLQGEMMCHQDDPGVKTPGISQLGQSVALLRETSRQQDAPGLTVPKGDTQPEQSVALPSEMMRQKNNPGETVLVPGVPQIGQSVALHSEESNLIREELSEPSVADLSDIDCRLCRKIMRRVKYLRVDNVVRGEGG